MIDMGTTSVESKPWYLSKTLITSAVAFGVAVATAAGFIDAEAGVKIEGLLVPLIFAFLRIGDTELTLSGKDL
jgi:hypothetical protein